MDDIKIRYFKDVIANDKDSYFIVKTFDNNNEYAKVIYSHGSFLRDNICGIGKPYWGVGSIHEIGEVLATLDGCHIIEELSKEEAENWWIHDI